MKRRVFLMLTETYIVEIEANSEEEAKEKAENIIEGDDKYLYHSDSGGESTAYEI